MEEKSYDILKKNYRMAQRRIDIEEESFNLAQNGQNIFRDANSVAIKSYDMADNTNRLANRNIAVSERNISTAILAAAMNYAVQVLTLYFTSLPDDAQTFTRSSRGLISAILLVSIMSWCLLSLLNFIRLPSLQMEKIYAWIESAKNLIQPFPWIPLPRRNPNQTADEEHSTGGDNLPPTDPVELQQLHPTHLATRDTG
jgi:hypothetical protein